MWRRPIVALDLITLLAAISLRSRPDADRNPLSLAEPWIVVLNGTKTATQLYVGVELWPYAELGPGECARIGAWAVRRPGSLHVQWGNPAWQHAMLAVTPGLTTAITLSSDGLLPGASIDDIATCRWYAMDCGSKACWGDDGGPLVFSQRGAFGSQWF